MMSQRTLAAAVLALLSIGHVRAQGPGFRPGDIYLLTAAWSGPAPWDARLMRFDPFTGQATTLVDCWGISQFPGSLAFDPWRDRIVFIADVPGTGLTTLNLVDAGGNIQNLGYTGLAALNLAPASGGRIYFQNLWANLRRIYYLDAANVEHTLVIQSPAGLVPFELIPAQNTSIRGMIYHPGLNALFFAQDSNHLPCSGGQGDVITVRRAYLSTDGSQVVGQVACAQFDAAPGEALEYPVGWSHGPEGKLLLVVRNTTDAQQPRMILVDPSTLAMSPFASNGPYTGAFATLAGTYSQLLGRTVILDSGNDVLRTYGPGETGSGSVLATGVSYAQWSSEAAQLLEIGAATPGFGLGANLGSISAAAGGTQVLTLSLGAAHAGEIYAIAGSMSGWLPGIPMGAFVLPLNWDVYTNWTLANANGAILQNTVGVLGATGQATAQIVLGPNAIPGLAGITAWHAAASLTGALAISTITNAAPITFTP